MFNLFYRKPLARPARPISSARSAWQRALIAAVGGCALLASAAVPAQAESMAPAGGGGTIQDSTSKKPTWLPDVGIDQKLGTQVPPDLKFTDDFGKPVRMGDYFNQGRPVLFVLVYFGCPRLCTTVLNEMNKALMPMDFDPGRQFDIVVVSFDPKEGPDLAAQKKQEYVKFYRRPGTETGWHFLTGDQANITALTKAVGFRYVWDAEHSQFIHAGGLMILTPEGKTSKYFFGIDYAPRDIKLALMDASGGKIGTATDTVLQFCFAYDPSKGKYTLAITHLMWIACGLTVSVLGGFMAFHFRRDRRAGRIDVTAGSGEGDAGASDADQMQRAQTGQDVKENQ